MCDRQGTERIEKIYHERYLVEKVLGEGGMGKVFLAKDIKTGKRVAVKIVKDQGQWERERAILKKLEDIKGVPKLFFAGSESEIFLVMEYIPGRSLKKYGRNCGKLSEKEMVLWMFKVCKVLQKIHERGIIHMDLKPENILLHPSGKIYLIDFGVSLMEGETLIGYGTKNYASKKQRKTGAKAVVSMDIYSLGKIMQLNVKDPKTEKMNKIINKCLGEESKERYDTVADIKKDLRNILWKEKAKRVVFLVICFHVLLVLYMENRKQKRKPVMVYQETYQEEFRKGMICFYGADKEEKDLVLAKQYFVKVKKHNKKAGAYLTLLEALSDSEKEVKQKELLMAFKTCEEDIYDFWSAYFFEHYYVVWEQRLSKDALKQAGNLIKRMERFHLDEKKQTILETEKLNLYEMMARRGESRQFFYETDKIFREKMDADKAWQIYQRKLSYFEENHINAEKEFERFIKFYPKVMEAYTEYAIYLCENGQEEKAKEVYRKGSSQTGMSGERAQGLRRRLGL